MDFYKERFTSKHILEDQNYKDPKNAKDFAYAAGSIFGQSILSSIGKTELPLLSSSSRRINPDSILEEEEIIKEIENHKFRNNKKNNISEKNKSFVDLR